MATISFFDYIKYNLFNMRTPELVEKMRIKEYADRISKQKYHFVDFKTHGISSECAKFIFEMYKIIGPLINPIKEEFIAKDGKQFSYYLIESTFSDSQKTLFNTLNKEYITERIKITSNPNAVFNEVKNNFVKFKQSLSGEKAREINVMFNLLKDFSTLFNFDFFLFLKVFAPSLIDGVYNANPQFKSSKNISAVDDLIKLDYGVASIAIKKELLFAITKFQEYSAMTPISDKNIKAFFSRVKYLQTPELLHDVIVYLLKDFTYKCTVTTSNFNIFIGYISEVTQNLKKDMDSIISELKISKISILRKKMFTGTEIIKLANVNEERNEQLEKYGCPIFTCVEPIQYTKTFVMEIFDRLYKEPLNELFLAAEFVDKGRSSKGLDAFYIINDIIEDIQKFDMELTPESENSKRLKGWLTSQNKVNANRDLIEAMVKQIDENGKVIILDMYNAIIDLTTIVKNIIEDCKTGSKTEVLNTNKIQHLQNFNMSLAASMQKNFDNFISLMKNFIR